MITPSSRSGLCALLETVDGIDVVGEAVADMTQVADMTRCC